MKKIVLSSTCLAWSVFTGGAQGTFEAVTGFSPGSIAPYADTGGWTFQPRASIIVTDLGCLAFVVDDYTTVRVGIWSEGGTELASEYVVRTNRIGQSYYSSITPIFLNGGETYRIGANYPLDLISFNLVGQESDGLDGSVTLSSLVQLGGYASGTNGFGFPNADTGPNGSMYLGPNFRYQNVPEPAAVAVALLGALGMIAWRGFGRNG